ncbi:hypothetical protein TNCV_4050091 [Trichonephila clavipes]|nr:hypothetical protein TNCV_4050091 [Trichonephila clavipes]
MDFMEINSRGKRGGLLGCIDIQNSRFRNTKTIIVKFGLHASFVELESAKNAVNEDLELIQNKNPFLDDSAEINTLLQFIKSNAAVQWTPAERNGSLTSTTFSNSFTDVTEIESLNNSDEARDFDDFSLNSDRNRESVSSDLTSLSDSEGDVQSTEGSFVPKIFDILIIVFYIFMGLSSFNI